MGPIERTLEQLRGIGYVAAEVDGIGFAEILAWRQSEPGVLAVRCFVQPPSAGRSPSARNLGEALHQPSCRAWLAAGNRLEIWTWFPARPDHPQGWTLTRRPVGFVELDPARNPFAGLERVERARAC